MELLTFMPNKLGAQDSSDGLTDRKEAIMTVFLEMERQRF